MPVGPLLAVLRLLSGRARTVGTGDILLFLGLGLHLAVVGVVLAWRPSEDEATLYDVVNICHELIGGLVMEKTHACEGHRDAILVAGVDNMVVADGATGLGDVLHTALVGALDVVSEGEEGITTQCHARVLGYPRFLGLGGKHFGLLGEELLPGAVAQYILVLVGDIDIDGVVAVGTAYAGLEGQVHHLRTLAEPPYIGLVACQTGAVDAALLAGTDTDGLSVLDVAHRVALGVLERDEGNDQVALGLGRKGLVLGGNVLEEGGVIEPNLVAALLKGDAEHLLALYGRGGIVGIYLDDVIGTLALVMQYLDGLGSIAGSYDTIAHLALDEACGGGVADIAQRYEVTIRAHAVGTAGTGVSTGQRGKFEVYIVYKVDALERLGER